MSMNGDAQVVWSRIVGSGSETPTANEIYLEGNSLPENRNPPTVGRRRNISQGPLNEVPSSTSKRLRAFSAEMNSVIIYGDDSGTSPTVDIECHLGASSFTASTFPCVPLEEVPKEHDKKQDNACSSSSHLDRAAVVNSRQYVMSEHLVVDAPVTARKVSTVGNACKTDRYTCDVSGVENNGVSGKYVETDKDNVAAMCPTESEGVVDRCVPPTMSAVCDGRRNRYSETEIADADAEGSNSAAGKLSIDVGSGYYAGRRHAVDTTRGFRAGYREGPPGEGRGRSPNRSVYSADSHGRGGSRRPAISTPHRARDHRGGMPSTVRASRDTYRSHSLRSGDRGNTSLGRRVRTSSRSRSRDTSIRRKKYGHDRQYHYSHSSSRHIGFRRSDRRGSVDRWTRSSYGDRSLESRRARARRSRSRSPHRRSEFMRGDPVPLLPPPPVCEFATDATVAAEVTTVTPISSNTPRTTASSSSFTLSGLSGSGQPSPRRMHSDLPLEWWERAEDCKDAKAAHTARIDHMCGSREDLVLQTTLWREDTVLEPNMFPYWTPRGVEHYTLWSIHDLHHHEVVAFVDGWLSKHMPHVRRWQYDDNAGERSIDLFHVHVFIETAPFSFTPREGYEYFPPHCAPPIAAASADAPLL